MKNLIQKFCNFRTHMKEVKRFRSLSAKLRTIVFYSEGPAYWVHLEPIITHLTQNKNQQICYVSSDIRDPGIAQNNPNITPFCIGHGTARTLFFSTLEAKIMVMTMPDLHSFYIKRSPYPIHYIYIHHSIVSSHMIYREQAFDYFDTIFCVGRHHIKEARTREKLYNLTEKNLFEHGYGRLDSIMKNAPKHKIHKQNSPTRILIAPSWGENALLETIGDKLIEKLLNAELHITVRPHPQTRKLSPDTLDKIIKKFNTNPLFNYEENIASQESLHNSDIMISDWSGAALEYAFGLERPVLFIDTPRKINNPEYEKIGIEPIEVSIRDKIGKILDTHNLDKAPNMVNDLITNIEKFTKNIQNARKEYIFNLEKSSQAGSEKILQILKEIHE